MLIASYVVNLVVLVPLLIAFRTQPAGMDVAFGADTPARRILVCLYATIAIVSLYALVQLLAGRAEVALRIGLVLLPMQILYKLMTLPAVGWTSPIVKTNLAVVAVHAATLAVLARGAA